MLSIFEFSRRNDRRSRGGMLLWWTLVPWIVLVTCRVLWGLRIRGRHAVPRHGPALFVCNHQSYLDPLIIAVALRDRGMRAMARRSLLESPFPVPWMLRHGCDVILLNPEAADTGAMKAALTELHEGRLAVIYPEGTRSPDGTVQPFKRGAWLLIKRGRAPVIPVAVEGSGECWPIDSRPRLGGRQQLIIGEPIDPQDLVAMGPDAGLAELRRRIDALRLEARADIRRRTGGRRPRRGPGDVAVEAPAGGDAAMSSQT